MCFIAAADCRKCDRCVVVQKMNSKLLVLFHALSFSFGGMICGGMCNAWVDSQKMVNCIED